MFRGLLVALCLFGAASAFTGLRGKGQQKMQPEVVARALTQVEHKWMDDAMALRTCDKANSTNHENEECEAAQQSFVASCQKIAEAIVQGSAGDRGDTQEYMEDICGQPELRQENTPQRLCSAFAKSLLEGMSSDSYSNRESLDTRKLCASFLQKGELRTIAEEELTRQEKEEARIEEEKQKEKEMEAQRKEQERKTEEAKRIEEEAERARQEAAEKAKAEAAKADQERKARELQAAKEETHAALEHVKNISSGAASEHADKLEAKNATEVSQQVMQNKTVSISPKTALLVQRFEAALVAQAVMKMKDRTENATLPAPGQKKNLAPVKMQPCDAKQHNARSLIQEKLAVFGVQCEEMCKEMGVYPKCQCPGFAGQPADADDNRACIAKNCQDPTSPCPNDAFMTCVHETTKVSTLQWDALIQKFDVTMEAYKKSLAAMKGPLRCPAPLFVAEGQFCVCKDPENCPSTAETLTPEQAAQLAAEAHTWNQSGAPGTR